MRYLMTKKKAEKMVKLIGNKYFNEGAEIKINFIDNARDYYWRASLMWGVSIHTNNCFVIDISDNFVNEKLYPYHVKHILKDNIKFLDDFEKYIRTEFNFNSPFINKYPKETLHIIMLLHEMVHALCYNKSGMKKSEYDNIINEQYENYDLKCKELEGLIDENYEYRQIPFEYIADKNAIELFNKHSLQLMSIMLNKTQKELKKEIK